MTDGQYTFYNDSPEHYTTESDTITIPMDKFQKGGDYTFFCSFPGHWSVMKGKLIFG